MVHIHRTTCKSTIGHLTVGQFAPHGPLRQQEELVEPKQPELVEPLAGGVC
jgi:hypothetical protein